MGSRLGFDALGRLECIKKAGAPIWPTARGSWLGRPRRPAPTSRRAQISRDQPRHRARSWAR